MNALTANRSRFSFFNCRFTRSRFAVIFLIFVGTILLLDSSAYASPGGGGGNPVVELLRENLGKDITVDAKFLEKVEAAGSKGSDNPSTFG